MSEEIVNQPAPDLNELRKLERDRQSRIRDMGKVLGVSESDVNKALDSDIQPSDFFAQVSRNHKPAAAANKLPEISEKKAERYDIGRVLQAVAAKKELTGLERDLSEELKDTFRNEHGGSDSIVIPQSVLARNFLKRAGQNAGTAADGGYMVPTETRNGSFIDILMQNTILGRRGAQVLEGLSGNVEIPKLTTGATMLHKGETDDAELSQLVIGQLALSPKRATTQIYLSNQLLRQTAGVVEQVVMTHLQAVASNTWDKYGIVGTGLNDQPVGITALAGKNTITYGGAAVYADILAAMAAQMEDHTYTADSIWLMDSATWAKFAALEVSATAGQLAIDLVTNRIRGHEYEICSYLTDHKTIFGDIKQLTVGMFGGIEIIRENVTRAKSGETVLTAAMYYDVGARYDQAFCVSTDSGAA